MTPEGGWPRNRLADRSGEGRCGREEPRTRQSKMVMRWRRRRIKTSRRSGGDDGATAARASCHCATLLRGKHLGIRKRENEINKYFQTRSAPIPIRNPRDFSILGVATYWRYNNVGFCFFIFFQTLLRITAPISSGTTSEGLGVITPPPSPPEIRGELFDCYPWLCNICPKLHPSGALPCNPPPTENKFWLRQSSDFFI